MTLYDALRTASPQLDAKIIQSQNINHSGTIGSFREHILKEVIRPFLPKRYGLATGESFDPNGDVSKQIDIIVYDDLFSYQVPRGDNSLLPFESVYGGIEVKSQLNKETFFQSISNISSLKSLYRDNPGGCQVLPNLEIELPFVKWNESGFKKPFGCIFAYDSAAPETVIDYFKELAELAPAKLPDVIVLYKKKTIILRYKRFDNGSFYPTIYNTYDGFMCLPCRDDTLPIFISYLLCRVSQTHLKLTRIEDILNTRLREQLTNMGEQRTIWFAKTHEDEN